MTTREETRTRAARIGTAEVPRPTIVYLGGFGRSGSTLVERMLGAIPGWANVGELVDLARAVARDDERCGCGEQFSRCPVWRRIGERAFGGWSPEVLDRLVALHRAAARQRHLPAMLLRHDAPTPALRELRSTYTDLYRAVADVLGARVVVDASKGPALGQALAGAPGLDLRMLNVVRDPRAVAWSWNRQVSRPHATTGPDQMWRISARRSALQWGALQLELTAISASGRVPSARLRYEDFVADPVPALLRATAELGLPVRRAQLPVAADGTIWLAPSHGLSGNPSRFRSGPQALRPDDQWSARMPRRDQTVVTALTLPLLRAYGYPTAPGRPEAARRPVTHEPRSRS